MRAQNACPSPVMLTRAYFEGDAGLMDDHAKHCEKCAADAASLDRLVAMGKQLPYERPPVDRVNAVFNAVLESACTPSVSRAQVPRRAWILGAAAAAIALTLGIYFLSSTPEPAVVRAPKEAVRRGTVHAHKGADSMLLGSQPDEIVRLIEGTITVEVEPLGIGERFRVVTGDAEVEVRGTSFDATAKDDSLVAVNVMSGKVEVRPRGRETAMLVSGEHWTRSEPAPEPTLHLETDDPVEEADGIEIVAEPQTKSAEPDRCYPRRNARQQALDAEVVSGTKPGMKTSARDEATESPNRIKQINQAGPAEIAFTAGWDALVDGEPSAAAAHFDEAVSAGGSEPIVEDASFWRAVANDRSGAKRRAADQLEEFLARYPGSSRACEAACMLGWKLIESGDLDRAEALFETAFDDKAPRIRKCAQKGLAEIERLR